MCGAGGWRGTSECAVKGEALRARAAACSATLDCVFARAGERPYT